MACPCVPLHASATAPFATATISPPLGHLKCKPFGLGQRGRPGGIWGALVSPRHTPTTLGTTPRVLGAVPRVLQVVPRILGGGPQSTRGGPQCTWGGFGVVRGDTRAPQEGRMKNLEQNGLHRSIFDENTSFETAIPVSNAVSILSGSEPFLSVGPLTDKPGTNAMSSCPAHTIWTPTGFLFSTANRLGVPPT